MILKMGERIPKSLWLRYRFTLKGSSLSLCEGRRAGLEDYRIY